MSDVFAAVARELDQDRFGRITAAPARRVSAADLANDLLTACAMHGVAPEAVIDLLRGAAPTVLTPVPLAQQNNTGAGVDQQRLPEHDQSPFK